MEVYNGHGGDTFYKGFDKNIGLKNTNRSGKYYLNNFIS